MAKLTLKLGQKVPDKTETAAVGKLVARISRGSDEFKKLIRNKNVDIAFKDEEMNGDDRLMSANLNEKANKLADLVKLEFPGVMLRITESWDDSSDHDKTSRHREARAVDITTFPKDAKKLGRLAGLAVEAGFGWVFFEDVSHVHASVPR